MSTFDINAEIDKVVNKAVGQLVIKIKKLVQRDEKLILKQYIASQKETARATGSGNKSKKNHTFAANVKTRPAQAGKRIRARERDYEEGSD